MKATSPTGPSGFSREDLIRALPYARRYGRALTGSQSEGDALVAASLRDMGTSAWSARYSLYEAVSRRFNGSRHSLASSQSVAIEAMNTADLDIFQRELLLLTALEGIKLEDAAKMLGLSDENATLLLDSARQRLRSAAATDVLIIEDEPIIAMDIEGLVESCGHRVVGVASSETEAVQIAARTRPGLILADINLGIGGDGASAVARILQRHQTPVIFVTAYPERLLTGTGSEPAFVITKPFEPLTLAIATYQAVTGGVVLG
jgi:CheY-like chemotaxis protein/DNA-directed RNA polymerase specialized sigma24 family protein